jgi:hypothetical protein
LSVGAEIKPVECHGGEIAFAISDKGAALFVDEVDLAIEAGSAEIGDFANTVELRIPMKPAMHSNRKPATCSDLKPASVPI